MIYEKLRFYIIGIFLIIVSMTSSNCQQSSADCLAVDPSCNPFSAYIQFQTLTTFPTKIMFRSISGSSAWFGATTSADTTCQTDAGTKGFTGTFKALLIAGIGTIRTASVSANTGDGQIDWVMAASTNYVREDETTLIGTTNSAGLFTFPLTNSISASAGQYWTAMGSDWTSTAFYCNDGGGESWTFVGAGAGNSNIGDVSVTSSSAIFAGSQACATGGIYLVCVQQ